MSRHGLGKMPNSAFGHLRHCRSPNLHCVRLDLHGSNPEIFETWKGATVQRSFFISFFFCSFSLNGTHEPMWNFHWRVFKVFSQERYFGSTIYRFSFWGSWDSCWRPKVWGWISSVVRNLQTGNLISAGTLKIVTWRLIEGIFFNFLLFFLQTISAWMHFQLSFNGWFAELELQLLHTCLRNLPCADLIAIIIYVMT